MRTARRGCISLRARDATTRVRHAQARQQAGRADGAQASRGYVRVRLRSTFRHPFVRVPREKRPPRSAPTVEPDAHSRTPQVRSRRRPLGRSQEERPRRRRRRALVHGTQAGAFRPAMSSASFRRPPDQRKNAPATPARVPAALTRPPPDRAAPLPRASRASASLRRRRASERELIGVKSELRKKDPQLEASREENRALAAAARRSRDESPVSGRWRGARRFPFLLRKRVRRKRGGLARRVRRRAGAVAARGACGKRVAQKVPPGLRHDLGGRRRRRKGGSQARQEGSVEPTEGARGGCAREQANRGCRSFRRTERRERRGRRRARIIVSRGSSRRRAKDRSDDDPPRRRRGSIIAR